MESQQQTDGDSGAESFSSQRPRVDLIFNEISGTGDPEEDLEVVTSSLKEGFSDVRVWRTTPNHDGFDQAVEALTDGANVLVASGGDGTVAAVAAAIKQHNIRLQLPSIESSSTEPDSSTPAESTTQDSQKQVILGVIPRGTANALSAALHIPTDNRQAAKMICAGKTRRIDFPSIPHADGDDFPRSMLLLAGIGLEAESVRRTHRELKQSIGVAAYALGGLGTIMEQEHFTTKLELDGVSDAIMFADGHLTSDKLVLSGLKLHGVTVANAAPPTSVLAQGLGDVCPDDGLLEIICVTGNHPIGIIGTMFSMLRSALLGRRETDGKVYGLRAKQVTVTCDPPQRIVIDGEEAGKTPITLALASTGDSIDVVAPEAETVNREKKQLSQTLVRVWRGIRGAAVLAVAITVIQRSRKKNYF